MNKDKKNISVAAFSQLIIIALGLIVPRVILVHYGSDINGLLSTITQIFSYMALLEAGIGQATTNALYPHMKKKQNRNDEISEVIVVSRKYYRKVTILYAIIVFIMAFLLPSIIKSNVSNNTIFFIVIFEGMVGVLSFWFIQSWAMLLIADGKGYIYSKIEFISKSLSFISKIVLALLNVNFIFIEFVYFIISIIKLLLYSNFMKKNYSWIDYNKKDCKLKLNDRNSFVLTEIAWTIFSSTDMIILSIFCSTQLSSVYYIYSMIFQAINSVLNSIYNSVKYHLGHDFFENIKIYERTHDIYNSFFIWMITSLVSVAYILIIPFIRLYTRGIHDINYIYNSLPLMFCLIQLLSWSRYISGNLMGMSGYAQKTSYISLIEALVNISLSIIFVQKFGIVGVTAATVIALPIKILWCTIIGDVKVMKRSCWKSFSIIGINYIYFFSIVFICQFYELEISSYIKFIVYGSLLTCIISLVGLILNFIINKELYYLIKKILLNNEIKSK